ncbi:MAG: cation-transporting P-type ATPase [Clostridiales bacterium]|nr:cation-transporting P-type ATPase [Clostridiales bacterium]MDY4894502.1 cation-transporting P-type ATPase [Christensenellaceae bacterium]
MAERNGYYGLTEREVLASREKYGANALKKRKRKGFFRQYLSSFSDPIIRILLIALAINLLFFFKSRNVTETVGIAVAVFLSTFVSTLSEYGSESAFERLMEQSENATCRVRRGGKTLTVKTSELVVGDILLLEAGERVPADGTLLSGRLTVSQSPLSGESAETEKTPEVKRGAQGLSRREKVFDGSLVTAGEAVVRVEEVGENTFYGQIAAELKEEKGDSPLKRKLSRLAGTLSRLGYAAAVLVAIADLINAFLIDNGMNFALAKADFANPVTLFARLTHALTLAIAVVVVAVPEGLPMMIAVVLSSNRTKMAKDNVLVKRAAGIEAAGGMQILFTDKTGTLTQGRASVTHVITGRGGIIAPSALPPALFSSLAACAYFNGGGKPFADEKIKNDGGIGVDNRKNGKDDFVTGGESDKTDANASAEGGNASDRALRAAFPFSENSFRKARGYEEIRVCSREKFSAEKKFASATLGISVAGSVRENGGTRENGGKSEKGGLIFFQGAPEIVLPRCTNYFDGEKTEKIDRPMLEARLREQTRRGRRVLALAFAETQSTENVRNDLPENAVFLGFAVLRDELRKETRKAVEDLTNAGVQVVMITGDHAETADAIAKEAGLYLGALKGEKPVVLTGNELAAMTDEDVTAILPRLRVVARALPTDKSRLVSLAQKKGYVTGMTGDGINDAAALKKADVGFALGSGTEVAKEAGDVVITDDDLSSVAKAVSYGRQVFKSIRQFVVFQLTMNFCAVGVSLFAPFIGFDTPVTVMQMLWINMIMDTLASLAFAGIKADERDMLRPPVPLSEPVLTPVLARRVAATGLYGVLLCLVFLKSPKIGAFFAKNTAEGEARFYTAFFSLFVFSGLFGAFHARTDSPDPFSHVKGGGSFFLFIAATSACQIALLYFGGTLFRTSGLTFLQLLLSLVLAATVLPFGAIVKCVERVLRKIRVKKAKKSFKKARNAKTRNERLVSGA